MYELLLAIHLLAAVTWVGGSIAMTVLVSRMDEAERMSMSRHLDWYGSRVITGSAVVLILAGIGLVKEMGSVEIGDTWIIIGLVGWVISAVVGGAFFGPTGKKLQTATPEEAKVLYDRIRTVSLLDTILVVLIVIDMAVKPGA
jgi:uncharacterized membrane protein